MALLTGDIYKPWPRPVRFLERMMAVPAFRTAYVARLREFVRTIFQPQRFVDQVAELVPILRPVVLNDPPKPGAPPHRLLGGDQVVVFDRIAAGQVGLLVHPPAQTENISRGAVATRSAEIVDEEQIRSAHVRTGDEQRFLVG
jgi:hypothetical protein